ncbi:hypothetical protein PWEIH_02514 [Listeria weihenstephanensis FSL R9-0317]|uniref:Uncharacterized protein n=1 Tax=Listeria weihenstephanensis TaxID=1006155 RepID=A0A1S7FS39_9LIST|nr:hypothetical protein [Listeria weihenstephanensis]AQY50268.1 hypothetical protein UE46_03965 [Listeria weihenstephanensis]EUJ40883.1 hypothetical protein PWEIH_02514 [Listeria weihenstephanensis FSL R9-0317]
MDSIFDNIGDWFGTAVVIIGILFGLISYFKKAETEQEEEERSNLPKVPKQRSQTRSSTKTTPAKKPQPSGYKDTVIKDAITNADTNVTRMHHHHTVTKKRVRGKMQDAIIMKEILDKPVSLRQEK